MQPRGFVEVGDGFGGRVWEGLGLVEVGLLVVVCVAGAVEVPVAVEVRDTEVVEVPGRVADDRRLCDDVVVVDDSLPVVVLVVVPVVEVVLDEEAAEDELLADFAALDRLAALEAALLLCVPDGAALEFADPVPEWAAAAAFCDAAGASAS